MATKVGRKEGAEDGTREGAGRAGGAGESSIISKMDESKEEAFLFILEMILGRFGVSLQMCCLWQEV